MKTFDIAHIRERQTNGSEVDLIILPLQPEFDRNSEAVMQQFKTEVQMAATSAGLRGVVCLVWPTTGGMRFIAPEPWHPWFKARMFEDFLASVNRSLSW